MRRVALGHTHARGDEQRCAFVTRLQHVSRYQSARIASAVRKDIYAEEHFDRPRGSSCTGCATLFTGAKIGRSVGRHRSGDAIG